MGKGNLNLTGNGNSEKNYFRGGQKKRYDKKL